MKNLPLRVVMLNTGAELTNGDRDREYGPPYNNLSDCADLFTAYLVTKYRGRILDEDNFRLTAEDAAWLNVQQKIARTFHGQPKLDTYTDAAVYSAIAGECAVEDAAE